MIIDKKCFRHFHNFSRSLFFHFNMKNGGVEAGQRLAFFVHGGQEKQCKQHLGKNKKCFSYTFVQAVANFRKMNIL